MVEDRTLVQVLEEDMPPEEWFLPTDQDWNAEWAKEEAAQKAFDEACPSGNPMVEAAEAFYG